MSFDLKCFHPKTRRSSYWRWSVGQLYVSAADPAAVGVAGVKINKKGGTTLSILKLGGWHVAFPLAKRIGKWPQ